MSTLPSTQHSSSAVLTHNVPMAAQRALRMLGSLSVGGLGVELPDQRQMNFGNSQSGPQASIRIHNWQVFAAAMRSGDIGFAESYIAGDWDTPDLTTLLQLLVANRRPMDDLIFGTWWGRLAPPEAHPAVWDRPGLPSRLVGAPRCGQHLASRRVRRRPCQAARGSPVEHTCRHAAMHTNGVAARCTRRCRARGARGMQAGV